MTTILQFSKEKVKERKRGGGRRERETGKKGKRGKGRK